MEAARTRRPKQTKFGDSLAVCAYVALGCVLGAVAITTIADAPVANGVIALKKAHDISIDA